ncbi:MAG: energy transducer TonB, partial [Caulobacterales bacterium]
VASIHCRVTGEGRLADCQVLSESPAGAGFGPAALALSAKLKLAVQPGSPTEIVMPVRFEPPIRQVAPVFKTDNSSNPGGPGPFYPRQAELAGLGGAASLQCVLRSSGVLDQCQLLSETPANQDFGNAALVMARKRWMTASPRVVDGRPLEQETVQLVVPFGRGAR